MKYTAPSYKTFGLSKLNQFVVHKLKQQIKVKRIIFNLKYNEAFIVFKFDNCFKNQLVNIFFSKIIN